MKQERIQDLRALESSLYEVVQEAMDEKDSAIGVAIDPRTLDCMACTQAEAEREGMQWRDIAPLTDGDEPSYDAVADMAAEYCFVR